jgi:hypothetical protein
MDGWFKPAISLGLDVSLRRTDRAANLLPPDFVQLEHAKGGVPCATKSTTNSFFEPMSKRRRGYPSETNVRIGVRIVHCDKLLEEKLGRSDLCPCGSGRRFKRCCLKSGRF